MGNLTIYRGLKLLLAAMLFICLAQMPYGYYQLVRFLATGVFIYLAFQASQLDKGGELIIYIGLALLFQPFYKVALGRTLWNIVDVIVGIWLLYTLTKKTGNQGPKAD